ncbi:Putative HTH-type transcriptional regulator [Fundidesulfovibrio magnetotacticus]|uniref:HTH-type transcriptional regulator n=1 Tax=Fundidesulfovibrio magnetotacticus TaxID=2730080 RepID=A0A6V8LPX8_9BACT|nr:Rrf2 family transcriptional regulator [Fundidesulfovibrio magnetotacticus]GFK92398.1 Putative HTH-type transcriptional regulator [Fundidesulfovibrio magnetotacticus]
MKLTRAAEYAIRCVLYLSRHAAGQLVSRREVAEAMDIPPAFLGKIAQGLARAGVLVVRQGALGGYLLALPPKDISLLRVVEAMDGEILLNECLASPHHCGMSPTCPVHGVWAGARKRFRADLASVSFADLAGCPEPCAGGLCSAGCSRAECGN